MNRILLGWFDVAAEISILIGAARSGVRIRRTVGSDCYLRRLDFTDKEVSETPEEMKIALETVQTLLKEEVQHITWGRANRKSDKVRHLHRGSAGRDHLVVEARER